MEDKELIKCGIVYEHGEWFCVCGAVNDKNRMQCWSCGQVRIR